MDLLSHYGLFIVFIILSLSLRELKKNNIGGGAEHGELLVYS